MRRIVGIENGKPASASSGTTSTMRRTRLIMAGAASSATSEPVEWPSM